MKIILADDDTGVIQAVLAILKSVPGFEVRVATTGDRALENAAALGGVDLLITDVVMEPMDGFTLRDQMVTRFPEVRTILISGYDLSDYPEQTQHHQMLAKPIDRDALLAAIEREFEPPPAPEPAPGPVAVARPVAVPQAKVGQPRVAAQPAARAAVPPATPRPAGQPVARAIAAPQATAQSGVSAVAARQVPMARPVSVPQPRAAPAQLTARPVAQPVARAPRAVTAPRAISVGQAVARAVVAVPVAQPIAVEVAVPEEEVETQAAEPETEPPVAAEPEPEVATAESEPAAEPVSENVAEPEPEPAPALESEPEIPLTGLVGQSLGAYQILRQLGEGRWGTVYAAVQTAINRPVGLKVLDPTQARDAGARARFIADARAKAHVQHPSILAVYEAGEAGGYIFYAHEYVEGRTMAEIKAAGEKLDEPTALKVLRTVTDGLAYLTIHKIPHSPPEPGTIFLGADGRARLGNLATQLGDQQMTLNGEIQALGRLLLGVLPAIQSLTPGMQDLVKRMVQKGPQSFTAWGPLLQGIKAIEPKVVPVEAAKISAQDRAAVAAVEQLKKKRKRSLYINLASFISVIILAIVFVLKMLGNERSLDEQVHIPAGEFLFNDGEPATLPEFWIDKYEVTYGQYAKFVEDLKNRRTTEYDDPRQPLVKSREMHRPKNWDIFFARAEAGKPVHSVAIDLNCPVMEIDWWDAAAYAKWKGRELPSEQEWEKAARGTKGFIYPWGDEPDVKKANSNADWHGGDPSAKGDADGFVYWNPVDQLKGDKSPWGVVGMAGNVSEWIATWDPVKKRPMIKGGSFMSADLRLDRRSELAPDSVSEAIGFRTVTHTPPSKK